MSFGASYVASATADDRVAIVDTHTCRQSRSGRAPSRSGLIAPPDRDQRPTATLLYLRRWPVTMPGSGHPLWRSHRVCRPAIAGRPAAGAALAGTPAPAALMSMVAIVGTISVSVNRATGGARHRQVRKPPRQSRVRAPPRPAARPGVLRCKPALNTGLSPSATGCRLSSSSRRRWLGYFAAISPREDESDRQHKRPADRRLNSARITGGRRNRTAQERQQQIARGDGMC